MKHAMKFRRIFISVMAIKYKKFGVNNTAGSTPQNWFMLCLLGMTRCVAYCLWVSPYHGCRCQILKKHTFFGSGNELDRDRAKKTVQMFFKWCQVSLSEVGTKIYYGTRISRMNTRQLWKNYVSGKIYYGTKKTRQVFPMVFFVVFPMIRQPHHPFIVLWLRRPRCFRAFFLRKKPAVSTDRTDAASTKLEGWQPDPLVVCYIAIEKWPFIDDLPIKNGDFP